MMRSKPEFNGDHGHPNPSTVNRQIKPLSIDLNGGQTAEITLAAE